MNHATIMERSPAYHGSGRIFASGQQERPRKTFETPRFVVIEWPEHVARACAAIRARRLRESCIVAPPPKGPQG